MLIGHDQEHVGRDGADHRAALLEGVGRGGCLGVGGVTEDGGCDRPNKRTANGSVRLASVGLYDQYVTARAMGNRVGHRTEHPA
jgi:hypothetical protein